MSKETTIEERRKKATLRKIERKHAGKIVQPYQILERLLADVETFTPIRKARFCLLWKSGWKTDKDGVLTRAQIAKCSETEREVWGDFDFTIKLHKELWALNSFSLEGREMDIFHELMHAQPEIDDSTGDQKVDERDRLCWRVRRRHPIQEFPEVVDRYGLEKSIGMNGDALAALDDEKAQREAKADENDAERPLLKKMGDDDEQDDTAAPQREEIRQLLSEGKSRRVIADQLGISRHRVAKMSEEVAASS